MYTYIHNHVYVHNHKNVKYGNTVTNMLKYAKQ